MSEPLPEDPVAEGARLLNGVLHDRAFPQEITLTNGAIINIYGLTRRELFAAMVLQGMAAYYGQTMEPEAVAAGAVRRADALLKELAK